MQFVKTLALSIDRGKAQSTAQGDMRCPLRSVSWVAFKQFELALVLVG